LTRRTLAAVVAALVALVGVAPMVLAQEDDGETTATGVRLLQVQRIDATSDQVEMVVTWDGPASALQSATIVENGQDRAPSSVEPIDPDDTIVVLAVDTGDSLVQGEVLTRIKRSLDELVRELPPGQRVGIVSFGGGRARVVQRPTSDAERLATAIDGLATQPGGSAPWAGLHAAARMVDSTEATTGNIVMVAAGANAGAMGGAQGRGAAISSGAAVWAVALPDRGVNGAFLRSVVDATGGSYAEVSNPNAIASELDDIGSHLTQQYIVTFSSQASGPIDLRLEVSGTAVDVSYVTGGVAEGATALRPLQSVDPTGVAFLRENGRVIGIALGVAAAALAALAIGLLLAPDRSGLDSALEVYTEGPGGSTAEDDDGSGLARTALIQRAVGITEGFAERQGYLAKVEATLERADLPLRAAEGIFFYLAGVVVVIGLSFVLTNGNLLGTLVSAGLIALLPVAIVNFLAKRRQKAFESLLPDTLQLLAGTLRAGYSLMQGVEAVSREVGEPMGKELRRVVTESRLGRPLEESLEASATRMESADFAWAVMAIRIQREVGGNLAELLMTVSETMVERERLRRDVNALTAEGRVSAFVLGLLPIGLGLFMYMANPEYIGVLFDETVGRFLLVGAILLAGVGFYWMKKVIEVDI
jgi:tight adherence protein B